MDSTPQGTTVGDHEVTITRVLDAPRELVWRAWTEPALFAGWFGTPPYAPPEASVAMDVRPGGRWSARQVAEDGAELPFAGRYVDVVEPERLVFTFEDPADPEDPAVELATLTLRDVGGQTEMTLDQAGHLPQEQYPLLGQGYSLFFARMADLLARH